MISWGHSRAFVLALQQRGADELPPAIGAGYGVQLLRSVLALAAVCIVAWWVLRWASRRGVGVSRARNVRVLERVMLDARRSVYLVKVGPRVLLLGGGDQALSVLAELKPDEIDVAIDAVKSSEPGADVPPAGRFKQILERLRAGATGRDGH